MQQVEVLTSPSNTAPPPAAASVETAEESETDSAFGIDFPQLFNSPVVTEDSLVTDAVTSGGDAAIYAWSGEEDDDDDDDDNEDEDDNDGE